MSPYLLLILLSWKYCILTCHVQGLGHMSSLTSTHQGTTKTAFNLSLPELVGGYIDVIFVYDTKSSPTVEAIERGLQLFCQTYPWFGGRVENAEKVVYEDGSVPKVIRGPPIDVSIADFKGGDYSGPAFNHSWCESNPMLSVLLLIKYTPIRDGVVIGFSINHYITDGHGCGLIARTIADFVREGKSETRLLSDRTLINSKFDLTVKKEERPARAFVDYVSKKDPMSFAAGADFNGCETITLRFTESDLAQMKKAAQQRIEKYIKLKQESEGEGKEASDSALPTNNKGLPILSSRDVLFGHMWGLHLLASHESNKLIHGPSKAVELAQAANVKMGMAADARVRLGLPLNYSGCCNMLCMTDRKNVANELLNGPGPAWAIREAIGLHTNEYVAKVGGWMMAATEGGNFDILKKHIEFDWCHGEQDRGFADSCCTDWSRAYWDQVRFVIPQSLSDITLAPNDASISSHEGKSLDRSSSPGKPSLVVPPNGPMPGFYRTIYAPQQGHEQERSFLAWIHAGGRQAALLKEGGALHHLVNDTTFIGREVGDLSKPLSESIPSSP